MNSFANWSVFMTNYLFVLYMALAGVTLASILHLSNGQWRFEVRTLLVSSTALFPLGFIMLLFILLNAESCFPWMAPDYHGHAPLNLWHDPTLFIGREIFCYLFVWGFFLYFVKLQKAATSDASDAVKWRFRNVALMIPVFYVLYGTMVSWDFELMQTPRWISSVYAPYHFVSNFHMFLALCILTLYVLRQNDSLKRPTHDYIFNYFAQLMLAFTILFTYFFFVQYLVMWYGDLPFEIGRYDKMMEGPNSALFWTFFWMKSFIPFLMLIFTKMRHVPGLMVIPAASIFLGTWIERYMWLTSEYADQIDHTPMTSVWDLGGTLFAVVAVYVIWKWRARKDGLLAT